MIKKFTYNYNWGDATATLSIDTAKVSVAYAKELLAFWGKDKGLEDHEVIDYLGQYYCRMAIIFASTEHHNTNGVIADFEEAEGYAPVDGSQGILLERVEGLEWMELELELQD